MASRASNGDPRRRGAVVYDAASGHRCSLGLPIALSVLGFRPAPRDERLLCVRSVLPSATRGRHARRVSLTACHKRSRG
ncbi:hypothetical protein FRZ02_31185, partial [Streptomyces albidoflavus]